MRIRIMCVLGVVGMLLFGALAVRAIDVVAQANIPFAFAVGNKVLPAGEYYIESISSSQRLYVVRGVDGTVAVIFAAIPAVPKNAAQESCQLVFDHIGNDYFLSTVWLGSTADGLQLAKSKHERELIASGNPVSTIQVAEMSH